MDVVKGNVYVLSPKSVKVTLVRKEKSSVAIFPGMMNVTVEGMSLEF